MTETHSQGTVDRLFNSVAGVNKQADEPRKKDTKIPRYQDTNKDTKIPTKIDVSVDGWIEEIRKAVKQVGKEASSLRITSEENEKIDDVVYGLRKDLQIRAEKTVIARIGLNYLLNDYFKNPDASILVTVLKALQA